DDDDAEPRGPRIAGARAVRPYVNGIGRHRVSGAIRRTFSRRDLDRIPADRDEVSRACAIHLRARSRLVNDLHTTVAIGDKCTLVVDLRPHVGIAETVLEPHARVISLGVTSRTQLRRSQM